MIAWVLGVGATIATGLPFLLHADGVDVPDDALYYAVASWEWLARAWGDGANPYFVDGKLGGVSLFGDAVPMGPFYPAAWLLRGGLPVAVAFPLACALHGLLAFLTTRWLAKTLGASEAAAALAGAAIAAGPLGTMGFVDSRADSWAMVVWFPVAAGAFVRLREADGVRARLGWTALAAAGVGLILLGCHVRLGIAATVAVALWGLLSGAPLGYAALAVVLGTAAGAPLWVPTLLEWTEASSVAGAGGRFGGLSAPVRTGLGPAGLPGVLAPRPWVSYADYGVGAVLGVALILGLGRGRVRLGVRGDAPAAGRLGLLFAILALASFSPTVPGLRYLFAPLLMLSHPVNDVWSALATLAAAGAGAAALDAVIALGKDGVTARLKGLRGVVIAGLLGGGGVMALAGTFRDGDARVLYATGLAAAVVVVLATVGLLTRAAGRSWLPAALVVLAVADVGVIAARMHTAVPSAPLGLEGRTDVPGADALAPGFVDLDDLARLEGFTYDDVDAGGPDEPEELSGASGAGALRAAPPSAARDSSAPASEFWQDTARDMQQQILERRWPVHLGMARGYRGLSGRAKLPPARQVAALLPLAEELRRDGLGHDALEELFAPDGVGARTLRLHGIPRVAEPNGNVRDVADVLPLCRIPRHLEREGEEKERVGRLLHDDAFVVGGPMALVEEAVHEGKVRGGEIVACSDGEATVRSEKGTVLVVRTRVHPGWTWTLADGAAPETFPVDQVHTGVRLSAGEHVVRWTFVPPGLAESTQVAGVAWGLLLLGGVVGRLRRRRSPRPTTAE